MTDPTASRTSDTDDRKPLDRLKADKPNAVKIGEVTCKGRRFELWKDPTQTDDKMVSGYYLVTARGIVYVLTRNIPRPEMLFPISLYGDSLSVPKGLWFRERNGQIEGTS